MAASHKERIESLEAGLQAISEEVQSGNQTTQDRLAKLEEAILQNLQNMKPKNRRGRSQSQSLRESETSDIDAKSSFESDSSSEEEEAVKEEKKHETQKPKKNFPMFNGKDLLTWISRANQFFGFHEMESSKRVKYAAFFLEEEANQWWQWISRVYRKQRRVMKWKDFVKAICI